VPSLACLATTTTTHSHEPRRFTMDKPRWIMTESDGLLKVVRTRTGFEVTYPDGRRSYLAAI
jgi:hypothetical protein